jgi:hypothetical protein
MAAYIIGMQKIASPASPKKRVVEQGFLEFFQDDGQTGRTKVTGWSAQMYPAFSLVRSPRQWGLRWLTQSGVAVEKLTPRKVLRKTLR